MGCFTAHLFGNTSRFDTESGDNDAFHPARGSGNWLVLIIPLLCVAAVCGAITGWNKNVTATPTAGLRMLRTSGAESAALAEVSRIPTGSPSGLELSPAALAGAAYLRFGTPLAGDSWQPRTPAGTVPAARYGHTAVWTGTEVIVWGGLAGGINLIGTGGRYNPTTNTWTPVTTTNAPTARYNHTAVWTGSEMIIWGGSTPLETNTGAKYNPATDTWTTMTPTNAPAARSGHTAVWSGSNMIVWGGIGAFGFGATGRLYNPATNTWAATATATTNAPAGRYRHTAVWTGSDMIVWGGEDAVVLNTGGRYNLATNTWTAMTTTNAPAGRFFHTALWTGSRMIIFGGTAGTALDSGGRYDPVSNTWAATTTNNATARFNHTAVWTGSEMIVWGGSGSSSVLNSGDRYDPTSDTWTAMTTNNAPPARFSHIAVWTGSEMIVWGGAANSITPLNDTHSYTLLEARSPRQIISQ